jgi:hypothetical protein
MRGYLARGADLMLRTSDGQAIPAE